MRKVLLMVLLGLVLALAFSGCAQLRLPTTYKVAFLLAETPGDKGWNAAHYRGIERLKELGQVTSTSGDSFNVKLSDGRTLEVLVVEKVGYNDADIERVARDVVGKGYQLVFGTWWNSQAAMLKLAKEKPKILFEHCSGYPFIKSSDSPNKNFATYFIRQEQGDYVAGYVTGLLGYSNVGLVGTVSIPEPNRGINGFLLGMQRGLKETGKDPKQAKIELVWINAWLDIPKEQAAAEELLARGLPVIRQLADTPYSSQVSCQAGAIAVGYGTDVSSLAPCALVTNEWNWGEYYKLRVQQALDGKWQPGDWWGGFAEDAVVMKGWNVSAEVKAKAEKLVADIKAGYNPFCGPFQGQGQKKDGSFVEYAVPEGKCMSDMDLLSMFWLVDGVHGQYPAEPEGGFPALELTSPTTSAPSPWLTSK